MKTRPQKFIVGLTFAVCSLAPLTTQASDFYAEMATKWEKRTSDHIDRNFPGGKLPPQYMDKQGSLNYLGQLALVVLAFDLDGCFLAKPLPYGMLTSGVQETEPTGDFTTKILLRLEPDILYWLRMYYEKHGQYLSRSNIVRILNVMLEDCERGLENPPMLLPNVDTQDGGDSP